MTSSIFDKVILQNEFLVLGHGRRKDYELFCCPSSVNVENIMDGKFIDNDERTEPDILIDLKCDTLPVISSSINEIVDTGGRAGPISYYNTSHFWSEMARVLTPSGRFHGIRKTKRKLDRYTYMYHHFDVSMVKDDNTFVLCKKPTTT